MDEVDEAARRTAINLMRLNETLEMNDADNYSQALDSSHVSHRQHRRNMLRAFYKDWFTRRAR